MSDIMTEQKNIQGLHEGGIPEKCGRVWVDWKTNKINTVGVELIGGCSVGCCEDYLCLYCGKTWRIEWPD